jgi:hypothetical protein
MDWQRIIIVIVILVVVGGGYYYFQVYNAEPTAEGGSLSSKVAELDARLNEIRPLATVELDLSLFDNSFFRLLKPITATSGSEVVPGRSNPFTPY